MAFAGNINCYRTSDFNWVLYLLERNHCTLYDINIIIETLLKSFCIVNFEEYVLGGQQHLSQRFEWVSCLEQETLGTFVVKFSVPCVQSDDKGQCSEKAQTLLAACVLLVIKHVFSFRRYFYSKAFTNVKFPWSKYLSWPFPKAAAHFFNCLHVPVKIPLIQCSNTALEKYFLPRKKHKPYKEHTHALAVPSPSQRVEINHSFLNLKKYQLSGQAEQLIKALKCFSLTVPCGNPFNGMLNYLVYESAIKAHCVVLPLNAENYSALVFNVHQKILARNLLSSVLLLPLINPRLKKRVSLKTQEQEPKIVICSECGHCLNFGRGKFNKVNFLPTHAFYCRDQKEKQFSICASSGRIYCSYCGSASLTVKSMIEKDVCKDEPCIRAVIANNAALMIKDLFSSVDVVVPCISEHLCSGCCFKRLTVQTLLYLTASSEALQCHKCKEL